MATLRAAVRVLLLTLLTAPLCLLLWIATPLRHARPGLWRSWRNRLFRVWAASSCRIIGMSTRLEGATPDPPFVLVCNHLSYVDVVLLARHLHAVFVAKRDVARWPVLGPIVACVDTVFVDRDRTRDLPRANAAIQAALNAGDGVVLFPEGTSSGGDTVLPLMPSLLSVPARDVRPVWYAAIAYFTAPGEPPARSAVCWWGDDEFLSHLMRLLRLPGFEARLRIGPVPITSRDRKALARQLHDAIAGEHARLHSSLVHDTRP